MNKRVNTGAAGAAALLVTYSIVAAQEFPLGKFDGSYQNSAGSRTNITVDIKHIENGIVRGVGTRNTTGRRVSPCNGDYPFTGTLKDGHLDVREESKGGRAEDCSFRLRASVEGNKLKAQFGQNEFVMSR